MTVTYGFTRNPSMLCSCKTQPPCHVFNHLLHEVCTEEAVNRHLQALRQLSLRVVLQLPQPALQLPPLLPAGGQRPAHPNRIGEEVRIWG